MFKNLYKNIGNKIKIMAKWFFITEAISFVITGIVMMSIARDYDTTEFVLGILSIICGPIIAFVSSWVLYAFGQLVEDVHIIRYKVQDSQDDNTVQPQVNQVTIQQPVVNHTIQPTNHQKQEVKPESDSSVNLDLINKKDWDSFVHTHGSKKGKCQICGAKWQVLLNIEFEDFFGTARKEMCYNCFCKRTHKTTK